MINKLEKEFLKQSNAIEGVYDLGALIDAEKAWEKAKSIKGDLAVTDVLEIHQILMHRLNPRIAGKFRNCAVYIGRQYKKQEPEAVLANRVWDVLEIINKAQKLSLLDMKRLSVVAKTKRKKVRREEARVAHVKFEAIHPFEDGNGRVGRILWQLHRKRLGLPISVIHADTPEQWEYYGWFRIND